MNQLLTRTLHEHNLAAQLAHENERLREAMHVIAVIAAREIPDGLLQVARLARNALIGATPPDNFGAWDMETKA